MARKKTTRTSTENTNSCENSDEVINLDNNNVTVTENGSAHDAGDKLTMVRSVTVTSFLRLQTSKFFTLMRVSGCIQDVTDVVPI